MTRSAGNHRLKAARVASGLPSQDDLAAALTDAAVELGLRGVSIGSRQVRRWESSSPALATAAPPASAHARARAVDGGVGLQPAVATDRNRSSYRGGRCAAPTATAGRAGRRGQARVIPAAVAADMAGITVAHRHLYWTVEPSDLHPVVVEHLRLGEPLLRRADGAVRLTLARALEQYESPSLPVYSFGWCLLIGRQAL